MLHWQAGTSRYILAIWFVPVHSAACLQLCTGVCLHVLVSTLLSICSPAVLRSLHLQSSAAQFCSDVWRSGAMQLGRHMAALALGINLHLTAF